jgi:hypothetical protein
LLSVTSALLAALLVVTLFLTALLQWPIGWLACLMFIGCLAALCVSLVAFIGDINLSLHALKLELASAPAEQKN